MTSAIVATPVSLRGFPALRLGNPTCTRASSPGAGCVGSAAAPAAGSTPGAAAPSPPSTKEGFNLGRALALPAYTYGAASSVLSGLTGFAERFPAGGVTINPDGIIRNPEWTRSFGEGSVLRGVQPILAGFSAGIHLVRGLAELRDASRTSCSRTQWAAGLDLAIAAASALQIAAPGVGGAATLGLAAVRFALDVHP